MSDADCELYWRNENGGTGEYKNNIVCAALETGGGDSCQVNHPQNTYIQ